jgi:hypothetical protein
MVFRNFKTPCAHIQSYQATILQPSMMRSEALVFTTPSPSTYNGHHTQHITHNQQQSSTLIGGGGAPSTPTGAAHLPHAASTLQHHHSTDFSSFAGVGGTGANSSGGGRHSSMYDLDRPTSSSSTG